MRAFLLALTVLSLGLAGCGDKDDADGFETPAKDSEGRYVIRITSENRFSPEQAKVPEGALVVWKVEAGSHTVEARDGSFDSTQGFNSRFLTSGQEYEWTATGKGDHEYFCDPHEDAGMVATLRVT